MSEAVVMAFLTGLVGGFGHCVGMCGPVVGCLALATGGTGFRRSSVGLLVYHAGRLTTYGFIGAVMGITGSFVNVAGRLAGAQQVVAVAAGVVMIVLGLRAAGISIGPTRFESVAAARVVSFVRGVLEDGGPGRLYPAGLVLGILPCGLSWTVFLGAAGTGSPTEGMLLALAFGLGTLPALLLVGAAGALLAARVRGALHRLGGLLVAAMGALLVLRGLRS